MKYYLDFWEKEMNKKQGFQPESSLKVTILKPSNKKSIKISLRFSRSYVIPFFIEGP